MESRSQADATQDRAGWMEITCGSRWSARDDAVSVPGWGGAARVLGCARVGVLAVLRELGLAASLTPSSKCLLKGSSRETPRNRPLRLSCVQTHTSGRLPWRGVRFAPSRGFDYYLRGARSLPDEAEVRKKRTKTKSAGTSADGLGRTREGCETRSALPPALPPPQRDARGSAFAGFGLPPRGFLGTCPRLCIPFLYFLKQVKLT